MKFTITESTAYKYILDDFMLLANHASDRNVSDCECEICLYLKRKLKDLHVSITK